jgi:hypothetical protein
MYPDVSQQGQVQASPPAPGMPPGAAPARKAPVGPIVFGVCAFIGVGWSVNHGWLGLALGLAVIASAAAAQARGRRALVAFAWKKPPGLLWTLATAALGALYIALGVSKLGTDREQAAAAEAREQAKLAEQQALASELSRLTEQLPQQLQAFREQLAEAERTAEAAGPGEGLRRARLVKEAIAAHAARFDGQVPAELRATAQEAAQHVARLGAREELAKNHAAIDARVGSAKEAISSKNWLAADADYAGALDAVSFVENSRATLAQYIPQGFDAKLQRAEINALRTRIAGQVATAKKAQAADDAKRVRQQAYESVCGPKPGLNRGDNAWAVLQTTLEQNANDPDSIEIVSCSPPVLTEKICWATRCNIRGKNAFGARVLNQKWYAFSRLGVEEANLPDH